MSTNAADRLLNAVDPKKTRGRLETLADARTPAERQVDQVSATLKTVVAETKAKVEGKRWKITVPVSEDARRQLKRICLDRDVTVEAFVRDAINAHLRALGLDDLVVR
jgi:hypothetical protein